MIKEIGFNCYNEKMFEDDKGIRYTEMELLKDEFKELNQEVKK